MEYEEFKLISKVINNNISFEDFKQAGEIKGYSNEYVIEIWRRWCNNPIAFISNHDLGRYLFEMVSIKMKAEKILSQNA
jgi:hypothetical protein